MGYGATVELNGILVGQGSKWILVSIAYEDFHPNETSTAKMGLGLGDYSAGSTF